MSVLPKTPHNNITTCLDSKSRYSSWKWVFEAFVARGWRGIVSGTISQFLAELQGQLKWDGGAVEQRRWLFEGRFLDSMSVSAILFVSLFDAIYASVWWAIPVMALSSPEAITVIRSFISVVDLLCQLSVLVTCSVSSLTCPVLYLPLLSNDTTLWSGHERYRQDSLDVS